MGTEWENLINLLKSMSLGPDEVMKIITKYQATKAKEKIEESTQLSLGL